MCAVKPIPARGGLPVRPLLRMLVSWQPWLTAGLLGALIVGTSASVLFNCSFNKYSRPSAACGCAPNGVRCSPEDNCGAFQTGATWLNVSNGKTE